MNSQKTVQMAVVIPPHFARWVTPTIKSSDSISICIDAKIRRLHELLRCDKDSVSKLRDAVNTAYLAVEHLRNHLAIVNTRAIINARAESRVHFKKIDQQQIFLIQAKLKLAEEAYQLAQKRFQIDSAEISAEKHIIKKIMNLQKIKMNMS